MKRGAQISLILTSLAVSAFGGDALNPMLRLNELRTEAPAQASVSMRGAKFSALGALPADTDSFLAVTGIGELASMLPGEAASLAGGELVAELDSFAVGISARAVRDLQRMMPLFQVMSTGMDERAEIWGAQANETAARAIVATQREQHREKGEMLIAATTDFHLAPVYFTLSAKEGGTALLHQLSMLPLMLPMGSDAPVEMTVRGGWRGFCVLGDRIDLSPAELSPEHEAQVKKNLSRARLYVVARVIADKLVMVVCSDLAEIKETVRPGQSLLASPVMAPFDASLPRKVLAVGYSSPDVVQLREELDMHDYRSAASFMEQVFTRLSKENEACAAASSSLKSLVDIVSALRPEHYGAERVTIWQEDALHVHMVTASAGIRFNPGHSVSYDASRAPETVAYLESTPVTGASAVNVASAFSLVETVQKGYMATLKAESASGVQAPLPGLQECRPAVEAASAVFEKWHAGQSGNLTVLLGAAAEDAGSPVTIQLRAVGADEAQLQAGSVQMTVNAAPLRSEAAGVTGAAQGAVFAFNLPQAAQAWGRLLPATQDKAEPGGLYEFSRYVRRIDGAVTSSNHEIHSLLRIFPVEKN